jgi:hypothetical protein
MAVVANKIQVQAYMILSFIFAITVAGNSRNWSQPRQIPHTTRIGRTETNMTCKYFVEHYGERQQVLEVFESFSGWYWFTTDSKPDKEDSRIRFGLVAGFEKEWGYFSLEEIQPLIERGQIWKVPQANWFSISHITTVYPDGKEERD